MQGIKTSFITLQKKPLVIEPKGSAPPFAEFITYLKENRQEMKAHILKYGGILFRGFPIEGAEGFHQSIQALGLGELLNYIGGDSPRDKVSGKVYTSTEAPASLKIPLHNEMSFIRDYPRHIYFYCQIPAKSGGATILADANSIYRNMPSRVRERFQKYGLKYVSNYYRKSLVLDCINKIQRSHKTWMEVFETNSPQEVEMKCRSNDFGFRWMKGEWLQIEQITPSVMKHPETGQDIWFNQAHLYDFNPRLIGFLNWMALKCIYRRPHTLMHEIYYGNGTSIERKDLYEVMDVLDACTISYPWQKRDLLVLDNVLMMHGRAPFKGKRKIYTALTR